MYIRHIHYLDILPLSLLIRTGEQVVVQFPVSLEHPTIAADVEDAPVAVLDGQVGQDCILLYGKQDGFAQIRVTSLHHEATGDPKQYEFYFHVVVEDEAQE